jgi:hypothetical protein
MKIKNNLILFILLFICSYSSVCYADFYRPPEHYMYIIDDYLKEKYNTDVVEYEHILKMRNEGISEFDIFEEKAKELGISEEEYTDYVFYDDYDYYDYYDKDGNPIGDGFSYEDYLECLKRDKMQNITGAIGIVVVLVFWIFILVYFCKKIKVLKTNKEIDTENLGNIDEEAC